MTPNSFFLKAIAATAFTLILVAPGFAADSLYVRRVMDSLASPYFSGRGYMNGGMQKAAGYIAASMSAAGLVPVAGNSFFQEFAYPVNTFPGEMELTINGRTMVPGRDFIAAPESRESRGGGPLLKTDSVTYYNQERKVMIKMVDKLTWSVAQEQAGYTLFLVLKNLVKEPADFNCRVEAKLVKKFRAANVCGMLPGTRKPDSVIVFTAHYDHLGAMGDKAWFAGANDNASGVALMLQMAKQFAETKPAYTLIFIAFAGEEAGLLGSEYFVQHPLIPLENMRFLINLDLMGNGDEGITVVNATVFEKEFKLLQDINTSNNLLVAVNPRGKARNSDHYWFTERGVPAFFIYTLGKRKAYHDVDDVAATVPLWEVNDLTTLLSLFTHALMNGTPAQ